MSHCLIFDIGKTNKKAFVFDEDYRIVFEKSAQLPESLDDDGDPCEDLELLRNWILSTHDDIRSNPLFDIQALNCTTYGASFVHLNYEGKPVTSLYNYLKKYPPDLLEAFIRQYDAAGQLSLQTASPLLGHLNSGLQLYWLKHCKPQVFDTISYSLHLPQWVAYLLGRPMCSETTSLGCHTMLWDFEQNDYHHWVKNEGIDGKFPPVFKAGFGAAFYSPNGLHDSSAALVPYMACFEEPFALISTGTWCITLNPFNEEPLSPEELARDTLCYLTPQGKPVKAARYFGGHEHDAAAKQIADKYGLSPDFFMNKKDNELHQMALSDYKRFVYEELMPRQADSIRMALGNTSVRKLFVDGGFSKNAWYMSALAHFFSDFAVFSAEVAQATALGAALAVHADFHATSVAPPPHLISVRSWKEYGAF